MNVLRFSVLFLALILALLPQFYCASSREDMVVATVGNGDISLGEYENLYVKTTGSHENAVKSSQEDREKFLGLVTNFRLKLLDAYNRGLDKNPEIQNEVNLYKGSLASSFLTEREVTKPGVRKLYEDRKTEYGASHILLTITPEDSAAVYASASDLIKRLKAGEDFKALAVEFSQDPSAKQNKGDLYYFTGGQMTRPFEEAVMTMQPGELLDHPVRTQFGLHIIKLVDKKPSAGETHCSHIMSRFSSPEPTPEDTVAPYAKIKALQDSLALGVDFAALAKRNSADPGSAPNGGDLGWFARRRWVFEFDEVAFTLKPGETSGIVRSRYGYHLIKCTETRPPKTFEESEKDLQQVYQQTRFPDDYRKLVEKLKAETQFSLDANVLSQVIAAVDTMKTLKDPRWADSLSAPLRQSSLMRLGQKSVSVDSVVALLKQRPDLSNTLLKPAPFKAAIDKVAEQLVFAEKSVSMERDYPEFAQLMKEYVDGILLYQIEQQNVWSKIAVNDSALHSYFDANREKFVWPDRVEFSEIRAASDSAARSFRQQAISGKSFEEIASVDSLRMKRQNGFPVQFAKKSTKLSKAATGSLKSVAQELKDDAQLKVHVIAHPDTTSRKSNNARLATQRMDRIKGYLKKLGISDKRILTFSRPAAKNTAKEEREKQDLRVDIDIIGRRAAVVGKVERGLVPVASDERSIRSDSLALGEISVPFRYKNGISIVKLISRDKARQKTFEEAGTELSSAFQEYESKRLEREWLAQLKTTYPVTEHKEVLKSAFPPSAQ